MYKFCQRVRPCKNFVTPLNLPTIPHMGHGKYFKMPYFSGAMCEMIFLNFSSKAQIKRCSKIVMILIEEFE